jgi:hypothetical protein
LSLVGLLPHSQGTQFVKELTGLLYTFAGSSKLAGFMWFAAMGYLGVVLSVKAACIAVPGLLKSRYALYCFLMPSIVFWPSSIGKEAWMSLCLGAVALGAARLFQGGRTLRAVAWIALGAAGAAMVRPHMAVIWLAGIVLALAWAVLSGRAAGGARNRWALVVVTVVALVALVGVAQVALKYLNPPSEADVSVGKQVTNVLQLTTTRTSGGGSELKPVNVTSPLDYPVAMLRTLTRPLLNEANGVATLLPAIEMTFLTVVAVFCWRRLANLPRVMLRSPYVLYAVLVCMMFGMAFSPLANLAILVRQRSLVMPLLLLLLCVPQRQRAGSANTDPAAASSNRLVLR